MGNKVIFTVEFDSDAFNSLSHEDRGIWINEATDALADYASVVSVQSGD